MAGGADIDEGSKSRWWIKETTKTPGSGVSEADEDTRWKQ